MPASYGVTVANETAGMQPRGAMPARPLLDAHPCWMDDGAYAEEP